MSSSSSSSCYPNNDCIEIDQPACSSNNHHWSQQPSPILYVRDSDSEDDNDASTAVHCCGNTCASEGEQTGRTGDEARSNLTCTGLDHAFALSLLQSEAEAANQGDQFPFVLDETISSTPLNNVSSGWSASSQTPKSSHTDLCLNSVENEWLDPTPDIHSLFM